MNPLTSYADGSLFDFLYGSEPQLILDLPADVRELFRVVAFQAVLNARRQPTRGVRFIGNDSEWHKGLRGILGKQWPKSK